MGNVTSLTRSGLRDWLIQRVTALVLMAYTLCLTGFIFCTPTLTYARWHSFFASDAMRVFSLLAILSILLHVWIGIWSVLTDYVKCFCGRVFLEILVALALIAYVAWAILVLWSL